MFGAAATEAAGGAAVAMAAAATETAGAGVAGGAAAEAMDDGVDRSIEGVGRALQLPSKVVAHYRDVQRIRELYAWSVPGGSNHVKKLLPQ